jgi:hypothetical protein
MRKRTPTPDGHSSRRAVTHTLQQPTRDSTSCNVLARRVISRRLFGLAPTGVYRATFVTEGAVGSYPTLSPLPHQRLPVRVPDETAVCFLLHCPSHEAHAACAQALPGSLPCGARTFLGAYAFAQTSRPSGRRPIHEFRKYNRPSDTTEARRDSTRVHVVLRRMHTSHRHTVTAR